MTRPTKNNKNLDAWGGGNWITTAARTKQISYWAKRQLVAKVTGRLAKDVRAVDVEAFEQRRFAV